MLNLKVFTECVFGISVAESIEIREGWHDVVFEAIKDSFTDDEFRFACVQVLKDTNEFYGKMPTPRMFLKYAVKRLPTAENIMETRKQKFLSTVGGLISLDFLDRREIEKFNKRLSPASAMAMRAVGGLSGLWERVHHEDYPSSVSSIIKHLSEVWDGCYRASGDSVRGLEMLKSKEEREEQALLSELKRNIFNGTK